MIRSLKLALRVLAKSPFVTIVAVLSLALGIGANSAIFSMFNEILLRPLPVPQPKQLVNLSAPGPKPGSTSCGQAGGCEAVFSYRMYRDLEQKQSSLTGLAAHSGFGANVVINNEPLTAQAMYVSGSYFPPLALQPAAGRLLGPADDQAIGANFVAVLSYSFWQTRFGGDRGAINQAIVVNGSTLTIVGVAPRDFEGTTRGANAKLFVPISMRGVLTIGAAGAFESRRNYWLYAFGRLKPGVSIEQASAALNALYHPIVNDVEAPLQTGMSDQTMQRFRNKALKLEPGARGQSSIFAEAKTPLWMLLGVTAVVLLIACANIANLLLARGADRAMEMGVRLALGASRRQLLTQLLTESVLLACLGGLAGLVFAKVTLIGIAALMPPDDSATLRFALNPAVAMFAGALSVGTGLVFGMFPALHSTRSELVTVIRSNAGQITGSRSAARFRAALVTAQIALSMALLACAGLFLRSLANVSRVDLGVHVENVVTFGISPRRSGYDSTRARILFGRVEDELAALPGVTGVTTGMVPLLAGNNWGTSVRVQGFQPPGPDFDNGSRFNEVGAGYFSTLGMRLVAGREFTTADAAGSGNVAVVNETFVKKFHLGADAVGKFMSTDGSDSLKTQIVGVVHDAAYSDVKDSVPPLFFTPWRQDARPGSMHFYVRTARQPLDVLRGIPAVMKRIDPTLPVEELKTMPQQIRENVFLDRMISILSAAFAILATLLAGVGLYGVLAYAVAQRRREIGIRMALGADARRVRAMVMRQMAWMTAIGAAIGVAGALGLGRAARSLLFGLEGHDPLAFLGAVLAIGIVALTAGYIPARRAAAVSPTLALKQE